MGYLQTTSPLESLAQIQVIYTIEMFPMMLPTKIAYVMLGKAKFLPELKIEKSLKDIFLTEELNSNNFILSLYRNCTNRFALLSKFSLQICGSIR